MRRGRPVWAPGWSGAGRLPNALGRNCLDPDPGNCSGISAEILEQWGNGPFPTRGKQTDMLNQSQGGMCIRWVL